MKTLTFVFAFIGAILGGITLFGTFAKAASAPQEAAGAALAVAFAVIPYVIARCVQLSVDAYALRAHNERVIDRLDNLALAVKGESRSTGPDVERKNWS